MQETLQRRNQKPTLRPVCEGDSVGIGPDRGGGVVAFVTNNSFLDGVAFDGMRKAPRRRFRRDLYSGLGWKCQEEPKTLRHNAQRLWDSGRCEHQFFRQKTRQDKWSQVEIFYARVDEFWRKETNIAISIQRKHYRNIKWQPITPDRRYTWLTEGLHAEFETFIPMGTKEAKKAKGEAVEVIFKIYSNGVKTNRDVWVYNFNRNTLAENMGRMIDTYNDQVFKWERRGNRDANV